MIFTSLAETGDMASTFNLLATCKAFWSRRCNADMWQPALVPIGLSGKLEVLVEKGGLASQAITSALMQQAYHFHLMEDIIFPLELVPKSIPVRIASGEVSRIGQFLHLGCHCTALPWVA